MAKPQTSFLKRQREHAKRERQQLKAARRAERKAGKGDEPEDDMMATPEPVPPVE
ncbi:MAG TPA: hypothetical protein VF824_17200 [Thermoanaerobaculia bacterium]|jgi:hypothetical protein